MFGVGQPMKRRGIANIKLTKTATVHIAAEDLPINLKLTHSNKVVQSIEPLGELMEEVFESL